MEVDDINHVEWVSIGSFFSEESSFQGGFCVHLVCFGTDCLGDPKTKAEYEQRAAAYDPKEFWDIKKWNLQCIAAKAAMKLNLAVTIQEQEDDTKKEKKPDMPSIEVNTTKNLKKDDSLPASKAREPFNPWEGDKMAKQLNESLENFLARLPPSTTDISSGPWIWITDPYPKRRPPKADIPAFKQEAGHAMESYLSYKANLELEHPDKVPGSITRMLKPNRDILERDIREVAKKHNVMNGKWMLFPTSEHVDWVWAKVAKATLAGSLGCAAKVATNNDQDPKNSQRLICIYTDDFTDTDDVKRVLKEMKTIQLAKDVKGNSREGVVYYKSDAYTYLDISSGNEYKLKASLYNSKDMFAEMKLNGDLY